MIKPRFWPQVEFFSSGGQESPGAKIPVSSRDSTTTFQLSCLCCLLPSGTVAQLFFAFITLTVLKTIRQSFTWLPLYYDLFNVTSWFHSGYASLTGPWLKWQAVSFWRTHISWHMMFQCPSLVRFILMTRLRDCPVSPPYTFYFPFATIKESTKRYVETMPWSCPLYNFAWRHSIHWWFLTQPVFTIMLGKWLFSMRPLHPYFSVKVKVKPLSCVQLFVTPCTVACRLLHPWDFPGKSTGVGCHFFLQGIFLTQGLNPGLSDQTQVFHLSGRWFYPLSHFSVNANYLPVG